MGGPWEGQGSPQGTLGDPQGGPGGPFGSQKGTKRAPKRALGSTFGRRGDFAKSLVLLYDWVHFGLLRGTWPTPNSTKRGRRHHREPDGRSEEDVDDQRARKERPKGPRKARRGSTISEPGPPWGRFVRFTTMKHTFLLVPLACPKVLRGGRVWGPLGGPRVPPRDPGDPQGGPRRALWLPNRDQKSSNESPWEPFRAKRGLCKIIVFIV